MSFENNNFVDGPSFVEWCGAHEVSLIEFDNAHHWRSGRRKVSIWNADRVLTRQGRHISELPDHMWRRRTA